jgi:amino acid transporter
MASSCADLESCNVEVQGHEGEEHCLEKIDQDVAIWHGREPALKHALRHSAGQSDASDGQGTVMGVIFPCTANILGVLLFLRLPWIVGKAGVLQGLLLVAVCCLCTFITTLSLSAVATNGKILGGGSYYLISRSLGPAVGAGVGLCFYMANSIGAAMYFMGTVEAWEIAMPNAQIIGVGDINNIRVTAFCLLGAALLFVAGGVKLVSRLGTVFLFIVFLVIACMYIGCLASGPSLDILTENFPQAYSAEQKAFPQDQGEHNFISLMALWFPAVTGIMAGSNRSADLKNPASSIPKGTLTAQLSTSAIYLSFVVLFGCIAPREELLNDNFFAATRAWPVKEVVMYGVMASTIGAGLTSLVSGSRLLSAIASDKTLPVLKVFAAQPGREPRLALVASGVLCAGAIAIGQLNSVAPILTMFFLMCYTCVNFSVTFLHAVHDPNWRPRFRYYHWSISLFGAVLCVWMMFAMNWMYAVIAMLFCLLVFTYATHYSHQVKWGDGFQGMKFQLAKNFLMHIDVDLHTKNWRPQILVLTGAQPQFEQDEPVVVDNPNLLDFVAQLKGGRGITIVGAICCDDATDTAALKRGCTFANTGRPSQRRFNDVDTMAHLLLKHHIKGFGKLVHTTDFNQGISCLTQTAGLGAFQPNCVMSAWPQNWQDALHGERARSRFIHTVEMAVELQKVMLVTKGSSPFPDWDTRLTGTIDIWWIVADGGILLLLPFLLMKSRVWHGCQMRLFVLAKQEDNQEAVQKELEAYVRDYRLNVEVHVKIVDPDLVNVISYASRTKPVMASDDEIVLDGTSPCTSPAAPDADLVDPSRTRSAIEILTRFSSQRMAFPEQPPVGNIQPAMPTRMLGPDIVTKSLSCTSIPGERDVILAITEDAPPECLKTESVEMMELAKAKGLNDIIRRESCNAELVLTNLPDMPGESLPGYFQLVEEITKHLPRCLLVRGTASEVITAFT